MHRQFLHKLAFAFLLPLTAPRVSSAEQMAVIANNHPQIELPTSSAPPGMQLHMTARLKVRNQAERDRLMMEHADPSSPEAHHEWTSEELHQHFGALPADFHMVEQWLMSNGFTITLERYGRGSSDSIMFTGTAAQAEKAFGVSIVKSSTAFANTSDPVVPVRIAAVLEHIDGLDNAQPPPVPQSVRVLPRTLFQSSSAAIIRDPSRGSHARG